MLKQSSLLTKFGVVGTIITALCCVTPILAILLGVVGLGWLTGYLDLVLIPVLLLFVGITVYAVSRNQPSEKEMEAEQ